MIYMSALLTFIGGLLAWRLLRKHGVPVAAFDAFSGGIAGKMLAPAIGKGVKQVAKGAAKEAVTQAGLGGSGELAGQVASGEKFSGKAIFEEIVGELGPGAVEVAANVRGEASGRNAGETLRKLETEAERTRTNLEKGPPIVEESGRRITDTEVLDQVKPDLTPDALRQLEAALKQNQLGDQQKEQAARAKRLEPVPEPPMLFQFKRNVDGDQEFGNQVMLRQVTEEDYRQFIRPQYNDAPETLGEFREKVMSKPWIQLVRRGGTGEWQFGGVGLRSHLLPQPDRTDWKEVESFDKPETVAFGNLPDSTEREVADYREEPTETVSRHEEFAAAPARATPTPGQEESATPAAAAAPLQTPQIDAPTQKVSTGARETITGSNERRGSEMPAEPGSPTSAEVEGGPPGPQTISPTTTQRARKPKAERPWDILDAAESIGKIRSKGSMRRGEEGYYGEFYRDALRRSPIRKLFSARGMGMDQMADALRRSGALHPDASVDDMIEAFAAAAEARKKQRGAISAEAEDAKRRVEKSEDFNRLAIHNRRNAVQKRKAEAIPVTELAEGDEFTIGGTKVRVSRFLYDPATDELRAVELEDGRRFETQQVDADQVIYADGGSVKKAALPEAEPEDNVPFSLTRTAPAESGTKVAEIEQAIGEILEKWTRGPDVVVVESVHQLPRHLRDYVTDVADQVQGMVDPDTGTVYLVAGNLENGARARQVLFHEAVGHIGVEGVMGEQWEEFAQRVFARYKNTDAMRDVVETYGLDPEDAGDQVTAASEIIARLAEGRITG